MSVLSKHGATIKGMLAQAEGPHPKPVGEPILPLPVALMVRQAAI